MLMTIKIIPFLSMRFTDFEMRRRRYFLRMLGLQVRNKEWLK